MLTDNFKLMDCNVIVEIKPFPNHGSGSNLINFVVASKSMIV